MSTSQYPSEDSIQLPDPGQSSPDQEYYYGWMVQHNRLWIATGFLAILSAFLAFTLFLATVRYQPEVEYVTLDGGYPVVWSDHGHVVIDDYEYVPPRLRAVVMNFIENRYGYDFQNLERINSALRLMSEEAASEERDKIRRADLGSNVLEPQMEVTLHPDYTNWRVVPLGQGRFQVTVPGEMEITDAERYPDPDHPHVQNFEVELTLQTVPATDTNPLGYVIVGTGPDIL